MMIVKPPPPCPGPMLDHYCGFRRMPISDSAMPITDSRACRSPWSERVGALENLL